MFRRATLARLCVKTVFMASVPAEGTRFRALRRHAAEAQRQANAAVSGAVQAGQLSRTVCEAQVNSMFESGVTAACVTNALGFAMNPKSVRLWLGISDCQILSLDRSF